jgi:hypothetical protein
MLVYLAAKRLGHVQPPNTILPDRPRAQVVGYEAVAQSLRKECVTYHR